MKIKETHALMSTVRVHLLQTYYKPENGALTVTVIYLDKPKVSYYCNMSSKHNNCMEILTGAVS